VLRFIYIKVHPDLI